MLLLFVCRSRKIDVWLKTSLTCLNQSCWNCSTSLPQETTAASHVSELLPDDEVIILSVVCSLLSVMGTLGNFLVLLAVRKNESLRTIPDLFITSLAFSDFSVCALFLPTSIYTFNHSENEIFVIVKSFLGHTSMVASATNMFAVTDDRAIAIRYPFKYVTIMTTRNDEKKCIGWYSGCLDCFSYIWRLVRS